MERHLALSVSLTPALPRLREGNGCSLIEDSIARVSEQVGDDRLVLGLSSGVESSVVAALLHQATGGLALLVNDRTSQ